MRVLQGTWRASASAELSEADVVRHVMVQRIIKAYER